MYIQDENGKSLDEVTILLYKNEIEQLIVYLEHLAKGTVPHGHCHLDNSDFSKMITVGSEEYYDAKDKK
ncbi:MAG: hypothetical protein FWB84_03675 [Candidatus Bathyarchaeota archaeon]|uniref:hypothetical protein n=1 Tax=Candidatus Bathycorpusculum sp. TaxID=2994959 RepID=UPI002822D6AC|nr:hypothetical protein [Candidatus Termiticorpusculum sp.]MCL2292654.1 hypothetical protein [Candidatus Termiticorpusculum sp.]